MMIIKKRDMGLRSSIARRVLALHMADRVCSLAFLYGSLTLPGVVSKCRDRVTTECRQVFWPQNQLM